MRLVVWNRALAAVHGIGGGALSVNNIRDVWANTRAARVNSCFRNVRTNDERSRERRRDLLVHKRRRFGKGDEAGAN